MGSETDPVLARIQAKIDAWQAVADSYRAALALEQSGEMEGGNGRRSDAPVELPIGAFRGMKIPKAIKLFLQAMRRKQTAREIAAGLRDGGMETTASNFEATVTGALHRLKADGEVLRFKDGWDLAEAHSAALRNRLAKENKKDTKTVKKRGSKARRGGATKKVVASKSPMVKTTTPKGPTLDQRIAAFLRSRPLEWFTTKQVAESLKETDMKVVGMAFARMVRFSKVAKDDDGRYANPKAA
jgi:hypothetical protein